MLAVEGREELANDGPHALLAAAWIVAAVDDADRQIEQALHAGHVLPHLVGIALVISERSVLDDIAGEQDFARFFIKRDRAGRVTRKMEDFEGAIAGIDDTTFGE